MRAALQHLEALPAEFSDRFGRDDDRVALACAVGNACLAEVVSAPGEDAVLVVDGEGVVVAASDVLDVLDCAGGDETEVFVALDDAPA